MRLFFAFLLLFSAFCSTASQRNELYSIEIPSTKEEGNSGPKLLEAMQTMLVKLTGKTAFTLPKANQISQFVKQYHLKQQADDTILSVQFDSHAINTWLENQQLHPWLEKRPSLLLWLAFMTDDKQKLIGNDEPSVMSAALLKVAKQKGLTVLLPELDLDDLDTLSFDDIWNHNQKTIDKASLRYNSDGQLSVQVIALEEEQFQALWRFKYNGETSQWQVKASSPEDLFNQGLSHILPYLVIDAKPLEKHAIWLEIDQIQSADNYNELMELLQNLSGIEQVELDSVNQHTVRYKLDVTLGTQELRSLLSKQQTLVASTQQPSDSELFFHLSAGEQAPTPKL